jgi:hypothetical protein
MTDDLPFKVVRSNGTAEVLARAVNLLIARGAYRNWLGCIGRTWSGAQGARAIEKSK